MRKKSGIVYELSDNRFGIAYHKEQNESFVAIEKVWLHVFTDRQCTVPEMKDGKEFATLKHYSKLKQIGFSD